MIKDLLTHQAYFITGIDTDAGKTIATGWLSKQLRNEGVNTITQKLIQTGCEGISEDICTHRDIEGRPLTDEDKSGLTCPLLYKYPCSPHLAATMEGKTPDLSKARQSTTILLEKYKKVLIEGAGGLMVPLTEDYLTIDYIRETKLPIILVTTAKLGSLNHTLLTIEVLEKHEIPIAAIIYNTAISTTDAITAESQLYLRTHLPYPLLTLPPLSLE